MYLARPYYRNIINLNLKMIPVQFTLKQSKAVSAIKYELDQHVLLL